MVFCEWFEGVRERLFGVRPRLLVRTLLSELITTGSPIDVGAGIGVPGDDGVRTSSIRESYWPSFLLLDL